MKIKKYTIDQDIPEGAEFMYAKTEDDFSVIHAAAGGWHGNLPKKDYFYFLVKEEKEIVSFTAKLSLEELSQEFRKGNINK